MVDGDVLSRARSVLAAANGGPCRPSDGRSLTYSADQQSKELKHLYGTVSRLYRITEKLAVPSAANLFLRGNAEPRFAPIGGSMSITNT